MIISPGIIARVNQAVKDSVMPSDLRAATASHILHLLRVDIITLDDMVETITKFANVVNRLDRVR